MSPEQLEPLNDDFFKESCIRYTILQFRGVFLSVFKQKKKRNISRFFFCKTSSIFLYFPSLGVAFYCIHLAQWIKKESFSQWGLMEVSLMFVWCLFVGTCGTKFWIFLFLDFFEVQILSFLDFCDLNRHKSEWRHTYMMNSKPWRTYLHSLPCLNFYYQILWQLLSNFYLNAHITWPNLGATKISSQPCLLAKLVGNRKFSTAQLLDIKIEKYRLF